MDVTSVGPSKLPPQSRRCHATNRRGEQCGRFGFKGTVPPLCSMHGLNGATKAKARKNLATQQAIAIVAKLGTDVQPLADPITALLTTAAKIQALSDQLEQALRAAQESDAPTAERQALAAALSDALGSTHRVLRDIVKLGIQERKVDVIEAQQAQLVAGWVATALNSTDAALTDTQVEAVRAAFASAIRVHQAG